VPPPPRPTRRRSGTAVTVSSVLAVAVAAALIWAVVRFASENPEKAGLGDTVFQVGKAERLARTVADDGPFLVQDPLSSGRGRNVYVQHLGDDPDTGWVAVEARLPGDAGCVVEWDRVDERFVDCRGGVHPPDGDGLRTYPAEVTDGQVSVDLRTGTATTAAVPSEGGTG
jgi:hypothetical protein